MPSTMTVVFGVIGLAAAVAGLAGGGHQLWTSYRKRVPAKISWSRIEQGVTTIISQLRADNYVPDIIVAIGRSGAILGGLVAGNMRNLPLALLDREFSWDKSRRQYIQSKFTDIHIGPDTKRVLVVVGEVYSGQTLVECLARLEDALAGKEVRSCTLVKSKTATCHVDYYSLEVEKTVRPAWVLTRDYKRFESPWSKIPED